MTVTDQNNLASSASIPVSIQARLDTTVWSLDSLGQSRLLPGTVITLQFIQGQMTRFAGCNTYTGGYTSIPNEDGSFQVAVSNLAMSQLACAPEIMQQETAYIQMLTGSSKCQDQHELARAWNRQWVPGIP